jgi:hypothetical protein
MKRMFGILMMMGLVVGVLSGCGGDSDSPMGPTAGPQGQELEIYNGVNENDVVIEYQFYRNGNDMVQHGYYKEFWEEGRIRTSGFYSLGKEDYETPWKSYDWDGGESPYWPRAILGSWVNLSKHESKACSGTNNEPERPYFSLNYKVLDFSTDYVDEDEKVRPYGICEPSAYSRFSRDEDHCYVAEDSGGYCWPYDVSYVESAGKRYDAFVGSGGSSILVCQTVENCSLPTNESDLSIILSDDASITVYEYDDYSGVTSMIYEKAEIGCSFRYNCIFDDTDWDKVPVTLQED